MWVAVLKTQKCGCLLVIGLQQVEADENTNQDQVRQIFANFTAAQWLIQAVCFILRGAVKVLCCWSRLCPVFGPCCCTSVPPFAPIPPPLPLSPPRNPGSPWPGGHRTLGTGHRIQRILLSLKFKKVVEAAGTYWNIFGDNPPLFCDAKVCTFSVLFVQFVFWW